MTATLPAVRIRNTTCRRRLGSRFLYGTARATRHRTAGSGRPRRYTKHPLLPPALALAPRFDQHSTDTLIVFPDLMSTLEDILRGELTRHDPKAMSHRPTRGRRGPDPPELDVDLAGRPQGPRLRDATTAGGDGAAGGDGPSPIEPAPLEPLGASGQSGRTSDGGDDGTSGRLGALRSRRRQLAGAGDPDR